MIHVLLSSIVAVLSLIAAVVYSTSFNKDKVFISSFALSILLACFAVLYGHLSIYILIVLPIFMVSDIMIYYFSNATPSIHVPPSQRIGTKFYYGFFFWILLMILVGVLYKFLSAENGSWTSFLMIKPGIEFSSIGELLWGRFFLVTLLLTMLLLLAGLGGMLMVRSKE